MLCDASKMWNVRDRSWAALILGVTLLVGCDRQAQSHDKTQAQPPERWMIGVLSIGAHEGESFQECQLDEPWYCFESETPPCAFRASDETRRQVSAAMKRAGIPYDGGGTFGVVLFGTRANAGGAGHMSAYDCEITAVTVKSIREVLSEPPDPTLSRPPPALRF